ncbi:hypothetical protein OE88DRAFT_1652392 [Heliocybe sulcata]|uniref:C2H2-type domain-containing protein n=1 Tax=Heliocybe sulcata TaxID=5364 RepID=A0A5C3NEV9_9AGAM|nr:hypothetical protein OE88DRAFT_1652392 [Heliocybe sulcata]
MSARMSITGRMNVVTRVSGQRFLRRNECRRHESRHALDFKAFKCDMCPEDESKSYSRQDTLKRHMTKAHGFPMSVQGQENSKRRRRRAKAEDSVAGSGRWVKMEGY